MMHRPIVTAGGRGPSTRRPTDHAVSRGPVRAHVKIDRDSRRQLIAVKDQDVNCFWKSRLVLHVLVLKDFKMGPKFSLLSEWTTERGEKQLKYSMVNEVILQQIVQFTHDLPVENAEVSNVVFHNPLVWMTDLDYSCLSTSPQNNGSVFESEEVDADGQPTLKISVKSGRVEVRVQTVRQMALLLKAAGSRQMAEIRKCLEGNMNLLDSMFGDAFAMRTIANLTPKEIGMKGSTYVLYLMVMNLDQSLSKSIGNLTEESDGLLDDDGAEVIEPSKKEETSIEKASMKPVAPVACDITSSLQPPGHEDSLKRGRTTSEPAVTTESAEEEALNKRARTESAVLRLKETIEGQEDFDKDDNDTVDEYDDVMDDNDNDDDDGNSDILDDDDDDDVAVQKAANPGEDNQLDDEVVHLSTRKLIFSVLGFLSDQHQLRHLNAEAQQSIELAMDCLQSAFGVYRKDAGTAALYHVQDSLPLIFSAGVDQLTAPRELAGNMLAVNVLRTQGELMADRLMYNQAQECFTAAISLETGSPYLFWKRSEIYSSLGEHEKVIQDCRSVLDLESMNGAAMNRMGLAQLAINQYEEARDNFRKALELEPFNNSYRENLDAAEKSLEAKMRTAPLTSMMLAAMLPHEQKDALKDRLMPLVEKHAKESAEAVVKMLLILDNGELLQLLQSDQHLKPKVEEAMKFLSSTRQEASSTSDVENSQK